MMETMSSYAKGELDISYIKSRILVMSYPREGIKGSVRYNIDDVKLFWTPNIRANMHCTI